MDWYDSQHKLPAASKSRPRGQFVQWGSMSIQKPARYLGMLLAIFVSLPLAAWANTSSFQDNGGQITSNGSVLSLNGSVLTSLGGMLGGASGKLGNVSFTTGALLSGSLANGGTFASGGSFMLTGNGTNGLPAGAIFTGTFTSPSVWAATFMPGMGPNHLGAWIYSLSGTVSGMLNTGQHMSTKVTFWTNDVPKGQKFSNFANLNTGAGNVVVPEPGTLALMATGLVGLAFLVRHKRLRQQS